MYKLSHKYHNTYIYLLKIHLRSLFYNRTLSSLLILWTLDTTIVVTTLQYTNEYTEGIVSLLDVRDFCLWREPH